MTIKLSTTAVLAMIALATLGDVHAGAIVGGVRYVDTPPKLQPVRVSKDQDYCGETLPNETYLIEANGGLKHVVVFIESAPPGTPADPQKENTLYNEGCRYTPRVMAFQKGEMLKVKSNDPKLHVPHAYLGDRTVFNLSLPFKNTTIDTTSKIRKRGY